MKTRDLGVRGERVAAAYLESRGYVILEKNWRCEVGEVDLIAEHDGDIVIIEVRTRSGGGALAVALESITPAKKERLYQLAEIYYSGQDRDDLGVRIDVVVIHAEKLQVEVYRDAVVGDF